jgi:hypothetical protein
MLNRAKCFFIIDVNKLLVCSRDTLATAPVRLLVFFAGMTLPIPSNITAVSDQRFQKHGFDRTSLTTKAGTPVVASICIHRRHSLV